MKFKSPDAFAGADFFYAESFYRLQFVMEAKIILQPSLKRVIAGQTQPACRDEACIIVIDQLVVGKFVPEINVSERSCVLLKHIFGKCFSVFFEKSFQFEFKSCVGGTVYAHVRQLLGERRF